MLPNIVRSSGDEGSQVGFKGRVGFEKVPGENIPGKRNGD